MNIRREDLIRQENGLLHCTHSLCSSHMHLGCMTFTSSFTFSRGNAVIRPAAKKHISPEMDVSVSVDMNVPLIRTNKSKTKMVIRRLVRIVRTLIVVAAVNVPLYMMLLFKDWIDK